MKTIEERLKSYEPLWENWTYTGEFLGEGAMSSVFEIQSTAMGFREIAALKIITVKKNMLGNVEIPENALNEIRILRDLSSCPNIVQYHDSTQRQIHDDNGELSEIDILIKMEKLKALSEGDKLTETEVIKLAKDMCNALIHSSEHNIIHRDIKPQNIFVDNEGTYKLGDFGVAKIISDFSRHYTTNIGTLAYTAPEVHQNITGIYNISSDIYSLGLVLYVFLNNGCLPFFNSSTTLNDAISKRLCGAPFPSPAKGNKNLKSIVMRACCNDTVKRYRTPEEMLNDLELLSTGGRKLVVDPFATLDANIDLVDLDIYETGSTSTTSTTGRLKINMKSSAKKSKEEIDSSSSGRLKISLGKGVSEEPEAKRDETSASPSTPSPSSATSSRLKINMRSRAPESDSSRKEPATGSPVTSTDKREFVPPVAAEGAKSPEKEKDDSFFTMPDSI